MVMMVNPDGSSSNFMGPPKTKPAPAPTPALTTTPINVDLRDPRGAYRPNTRKTKNYGEEEPQAMKKGGLVKKKTTTKKKK
jgi:hypothetical protein